MERNEVIERNTALLSRRQLYGVVPNDSRKRKVSDPQETERKIEKERGGVKYIGETSLSAYERIKEHYKDFDNLSIKSHILKHYIERHRNLERSEMKFRVRVLKSYHFAFERQIGENVFINHNLREGASLLNSKKHNRCIIPRLGINLDKDELEEELEESEKERELKREIHKIREKIRYGKQIQKEKKRKVEREIREEAETKETDTDL